MHLRVLVAVPSQMTWFADFGMSLVNLVACFANTPVKGYHSQELRVANVKGSILPKQRLNALKLAKEVDATHLLFLDSDHTFPQSTLHQLLSRGKDCIAANCVTKTIPATTTARGKGNDGFGEIVYSDPENHGVEKVWRVGTGVMLLSKRAYMQIPHSAFGMPYREEVDDYQGEDWTMADALDTAGVPIYVDHDLSRKIGHIGQFVYTHDVVGTVVRESGNGVF